MDWKGREKINYFLERHQKSCRCMITEHLKKSQATDIQKPRTTLSRILRTAQKSIHSSTTICDFS